MENIPQTPEQYRVWWAANTDIPYGYCWCGCGEQTNLARQTELKYIRPHIKHEPYTYLLNHHRKMTVEVMVEDRGHDTPCWIWQGKPDRNGYGKKCINGRVTRAHQHFYERHYGFTPQGQHLHHLCEVRICVNPSHLRPVTPLEHNRLRRNNKLDLKRANEIRRIYAIGYKSMNQIAREFNIGVGLVSQVIHEQIWCN